VAGLELDRRRFLALAATTGAALAVPMPFRAHAESTFAFRELDAADMSRLVRAGEVHPHDLVAAARDAIERLDPKINAVVTKFYDHAFELAEKSDAAQPFAGVPYLIKDLSDYAGFRTTFGSRMSAENVSTTTGPVAAAAVASGLIPLGKSSTPEYGQLPTTEPLVHGPTRNPWNLAYSAGGSSGGSSAAVASGMVPIALSSDGGGSIRIPACNCGVFGLKVSRGRNVGAGAGSTSFSVRGANSRSVRDSALHLHVTQQTGANAHLPPTPLVTGPAQRRLTIGLVFDGVGGVAPSDEVREGVVSAARLCEGLGHTVVETRFPDSVHGMGNRLMDATSRRILGIAKRAEASLGRPVDEREFEPWSLQIIEHARGITDERHAESVAYLEGMARDTRAMFEDFDVLLSPVLATRAVKIGYLSPAGDISFDEMLGRNQGYLCYTTVFNVSGDPAMSVPLHWADDGMPIGIHFAAGVGQEATLLSLAYELEAARPWKDRHPPTSVWNDG